MNKVYPHTVHLVHETVVGLLGKISKKCAGRILDAGAGNGALSGKLNAMGFEAWACDINPNEFKVKGVRFDKVDLNQSLPYENGFFDYVVCVETIEHLWNPWGLIKEFSRILKQEGWLILTTPNVLSISSRLLFLTKGRFAWFSDINYKEDGHITPIPLWLLKIILKRNSFEVKEVRFNRGWIPVLRIPIKTKNILFGEILILGALKR